MNESEILANIRTVRTSQLEIAYCAFGKPDGWPCILNHGFPYDIHCYSQCIKPLADAGAFVVVPYLRGYGMTHFLSDDTLRSGEQAALANDLLELMNALSIERAVLAGYDWGGRAACIVAALWPSRVTGEFRFWYQYYFHSERGQRGLAKDRRGIAHLLWSKWSPSWKFTDEEFERTAVSFDNCALTALIMVSVLLRHTIPANLPVRTSIVSSKMQAIIYRRKDPWTGFRQYLMCVSSVESNYRVLLVTAIQCI